MRILFRQVRVMDPLRDYDAVVDVLIEGGIITRVGPDADAGIRENAHMVEGRGRWLVPGFLDLHTHLREPGHEYKEDLKSGLRAAAAGGYVSVCAMPNTKPVNDTRSITEMLVSRSRDLGGTRLLPIGAITVGQAGRELTEMADLRDAGAVAVSDDGRCVSSSAVMRHALEYASTFDLPVIQHAEDHALTEGADMHEGAVSARLGLRGWPRVAEDIIVARDLLLTQAVGARYHLAHASTRGAVALLREAKSRGLRATAEVTPHHLLLTHEAVVGYRTACKVNPPLREQDDVDALRDALADGTLDAIATDHAPHSSLEKDCPFGDAAPGMMGLELVAPLMFGLAGTRPGLTAMRILSALTVGPARALGFAPPSVREGAVADLVLYDPERAWSVSREHLFSKSDNTPFLGQTLSGRVLLTMVSGKVVHSLVEGIDGPVSDALGARS